MECEVTDPILKRILAEAQADKVARRLLGFPRAGKYKSVHATENLPFGQYVVLDGLDAKKWNGIGQPDGVTVSPLGRGLHGWVQIKS
jgi:hypothetical protein